MAVRQHGYFPGGEIGHAASSHCVCNKAICVEKIIHLAAERRMEVNFFRVGNGGSMRFAGIDIGSRTIELVVVNDAGEIKGQFSGGHRI
jgi:activator of 2-hydroxyglutaryl-CoA dehydratase